MKMDWITKIGLGLSAGMGMLMVTAGPVLAQAAKAPVPDKGDTAWMLVSTVLVLLMIVPGLALFYGGLVRANNILSVLVLALTVAALPPVLWVAYGYSLAFDGGGALLGGTGKLFLHVVGPASVVDTFTAGVRIPE